MDYTWLKTLHNAIFCEGPALSLIGNPKPNPLQDSHDPQLVACEVCRAEIPISEAKSEEAVDYVLHFCGLSCYAKWKDQEKLRKGS